MPITNKYKMAAFEELGVMPEIIKACNSLNWLLPKPVQAEAIPLILGGGDVCISAETGSGKTGAFALPLIQIVFEEKYTKTTSNESRSVKDFDNVIISGAASDPTLKIDPSGLHVQSDRPSWVGGKAGIGVRNGRYYYEAKVEGTGIARIGWATAAASLDLGTDRQGFGFGGTGKYAFGREFNNYGEPFGDGDVIGCYLNAEEGELFFSKNGKTFPPQMLPPNLKGQLLFPAFCIKACSLSFCFGDDEGAEDEATSSAPRNVGEDAEEADSNANSLFQFKPAPTTKGDPFLPIASCPASSSSLFISGASTASTDSSSACSPLIFVLEPVRELAEQTMTVMKQLSSYLPAPGLKVAMLTGGVPAREALDAVASHPDILISTPGKALELVNSGQISFGSIKEFVIDEADRILGDAKDTTGYTLFNAAKKSSCLGQPMQTILVSATLHTEEMKKAIETMLSFPTWADLKGSKSVPECVHHVLVRIDPNEHFKQPPFTPIQTDGIFDIDRSTSKEAVMSQAIKVRKAYVLKDVLDTVKPEQALIFCRTKLDCDNLEQFFNQFQKSKVVENNYSCAVLHADRSPQEACENERD